MGAIKGSFQWEGAGGAGGAGHPGGIGPIGPVPGTWQQQAVLAGIRLFSCNAAAWSLYGFASTGSLHPMMIQTGLKCAPDRKRKSQARLFYMSYFPSNLGYYY